MTHSAQGAWPHREVTTQWPPAWELATMGLGATLEGGQVRRPMAPLGKQWLGVGSLNQLRRPRGPRAGQWKQAHRSVSGARDSVTAVPTPAQMPLALPRVPGAWGLLGC